MASSTYHCFEGDTAANLDDAAESNTLAADSDYSYSNGMIIVIGLNSWIDTAIQTLKTTSASSCHNNQNQHNNIVSSREYLSCAIKIAHSLADQLRVVDEKKKVTVTGVDGEGGDIAFLDPSLLNEIMAGPQQQPPQPQWRQRKYESLAHSIYVRCHWAKQVHDETDDGSRAAAYSNNDLEPLPLHPAQSSEADDLDLGLGIFGQHLSSLLEDEGGSNHTIIEYLNVERATLREDVIREMCINDDARIVVHALGATFFQLFSGGQKVMEGVDTVEIMGTEPYDRLDHVSKKTHRTSPSSMLSFVCSLRLDQQHDRLYRCRSSSC